MSECFVNRFDSRSVLTKSHRQVVKANEKSLKRKRGLLAVMHLVLVNKSNADVLSWTARTEAKKQKKTKKRIVFLRSPAKTTLYVLRLTAVPTTL